MSNRSIFQNLSAQCWEVRTFSYAIKSILVRIWTSTCLVQRHSRLKSETTYRCWKCSKTILFAFAEDRSAFRNFPIRSKSFTVPFSTKWTLLLTLHRPSKFLQIAVGVSPLFFLIIFLLESFPDPGICGIQPS